MTDKQHPAPVTFEDFFKRETPSTADPIGLPVTVFHIVYRNINNPSHAEHFSTCNAYEAKNKIKTLEQSFRNGTLKNIHVYKHPLSPDAWQGVAVRIPTEISLVELETE